MGTSAIFRQLKNASPSGFSLIEMLLVITLLSLTILPLTLMTSQNFQLARGTYIQSTRSLAMNRLSTEMLGNRPDFKTSFQQNSLNTTDIIESGEGIAYRRSVDTATSDILQKNSYLYFYNNSTDASGAARNRLKVYQLENSFRLRLGSATPLIDSLNRFWHGDSLAYDAINIVPGYVTARTATNTASDILNTYTPSDDALFQYGRTGTGATNIDYTFPLQSGSYTVKLYFVETDATVTNAAPNRRLMDIYLESGLKNATAYSPYGVTGATYLANIQISDVLVSDGALNISVRKNSNSDKDAILSGIEIIKRTMK